MAERGVVRLTPEGIATAFTVPASPDPGEGALLTRAITAGPSGALWVFVTGRKTGAIEEVTTDVRFVARYPVGDEPPPGGLIAGPDGNLWFTEYQSRRAGRMTPTGQLTTFALPTDSASD
jgi:virginiamycin B lyase